MHIHVLIYSAITNHRKLTTWLIYVDSAALYCMYAIYSGLMQLRTALEIATMRTWLHAWLQFHRNIIAVS